MTSANAFFYENQTKKNRSSVFLTICPGLAVVILLERISIAWILKKECLEIEGIHSFALAGNLNFAVSSSFCCLII